MYVIVVIQWYPGFRTSGYQSINKHDSPIRTLEVRIAKYSVAKYSLDVITYIQLGVISAQCLLVKLEPNVNCTVQVILGIELVVTENNSTRLG